MIRKGFAILSLGILMATQGCSYGAMAFAPNGTLFVARNDSFLAGALRAIYACTPGAGAMTCVSAGGP